MKPDKIIEHLRQQFMFQEAGFQALIDYLSWLMSVLAAWENRGTQFTSLTISFLGQSPSSLQFSSSVQQTWSLLSFEGLDISLLLEDTVHTGESHPEQNHVLLTQQYHCFSTTNQIWFFSSLFSKSSTQPCPFVLPFQFSLLLQLCCQMSPVQLWDDLW